MAESIEIVEQIDKCNFNRECAVCLQKCVHPVQLPCGHVFCFLCLKGFANQNRKCAMCRQEIPRDSIDQPHLLEPVLIDKLETFDDGYQWFYEGRNGWWQYDERTSKDLEVSYKNNEKTSELLIAGCLYIIDLENMLQIRRNDPSRRRRIKRDYSTVPRKGVAGLHQSSQTFHVNDNVATSSKDSTVNASTANADSTEAEDGDTDDLERQLRGIILHDH
ncbi:unnamed protein product [Phyllotreta striolata]|uniref:E3 ubiquitin-protein ligase n=1 Tax=Phyllotreta striolata TaxID=444603 RepID=A0A9N9TLN5_PHYSR|nr:unnamed protein product [Phyllotreta striolata]